LKEIFVEGINLPDAYHKALVALKDNGTELDCQDYNTRQLECSMTVYIKQPTTEPRISKLFYDGAQGLQKYVGEMVDGSMDWIIGKTPSYHYTYHSRFAPYLQATIDELYRSPSTRRAIISVRDNAFDTNTSNPSCLQSLQFFIREEKLDLQVLFRSNDLPEAFFENAFALIRLQEIVADSLNIPVGTYTHRSNSMHCYEKNFASLEGMCKRIKNEPLDELCFFYKGDYEDQMLEEMPNIEKFINDLKRKYGDK
jgi:thymidylate synthase